VQYISIDCCNYVTVRSRVSWPTVWAFSDWQRTDWLDCKVCEQCADVSRKLVATNVRVYARSHEVSQKSRVVNLYGVLTTRKRRP